MSAILSLHVRPSICETRVGKPDDLAFVVDSWTKNDPDFRNTFLRDSTRHVRTLLARIESRLLVAHVPGEPDAILGWVAIEASTPSSLPCIHYVYVRRDARRQGVARAMLGDVRDRMEYSHAAPKGVVVPATWTLNLKRAETKT